MLLKIFLLNFIFFYFIVAFVLQLNSDTSVNEALATDLSILTARAAHLYQTGDLVGAYNITNEILNEAGMFQVQFFCLRKLV